MWLRIGTAGLAVAATAILSTAGQATRTTAGAPTATPACPICPTSGAALRALAATVAATPDNAETDSYAYHHMRRWILDTTGWPASQRPNTPALFATDQHRWAAAAGSGRILDRQLPPDFQLVSTRPEHHSTDAELAHAPAVRTEHQGGAMGSPIPEPSADPAILARQLDSNLNPTNPRTPLSPSTRSTPPATSTSPQRVAVLTVLADIDGLTYQPQALDRAGRAGVARVPRIGRFT